MLKKLVPFIASCLLLILAIGWNYFSRESFNDQSQSIQIGRNLNREILSLEAEAFELSKDSSTVKWSSLQHSFYLLDQGRITEWSKNDYSIGLADLNGDFKLKLLQTPRMDLLLYRFPRGPKSIIGIIPLRIGYEIVNRYLTTTWNENIFPVQGTKIFSVNDSLGEKICSKNLGCLFKVQLPQDAFIENEVSVGLVTAAIAFLLISVFRAVRYFHRSNRHLTAFTILFGSLALIRIAMVQFQFPGRWIYAELFDPKYFASSSFNASVGDFFLNSFIVVISCAYLFRIYPRTSLVKISSKKRELVKWLISSLLILGCFFAFLFPHLFVESIFHDSAISVDITSGVGFNGLRIVAFCALAMGCVSSFFFVHILIRWTKLLIKSKWQFVFVLFIGAALFICYFVFSGLNYWVTLFVGLVYFLILYYSNYFRSLSSIGSRIFFFLMVSVIAYSTQGALGIWRFAEEKEIRSMFRSASNLINRDVLGEYLLNEAAQNIVIDKSILSGMASSLIDKDVMRQKIRQVHLNSYFDRYEVKVKLYHADGSPADNGIDDFATSIKAFQNEANKTSYEGIYLIHSAAAETVKHYLAVIHVKSNSSSLGYVVLDLILKQIVPQQVYPELLVDNRFAQALRNKNYSYAFFNRGELIGSVGGFNFNKDFDSGFLKEPMLFSKGIKANEYWLAGVEDETGRQAIVSSGVYPIFFTIANFSFLFVLGIGIILFFFLGYLISQARKRITLNYSTRIQLYVYLAFILPLVVVSSIALRMISQSDDLQLEKEIRDKGIQITESIANLFDHPDTLSRLRDIQIKVNETALASSVDANIYSSFGDLLASSQPTIFNRQLVMPLPNRGSWEKIVKEKSNIVQARCRIGLLDYNSLFFAIRTPGKNQLTGILELPFLKSNSEPAKVSVLTNIIVTFVVVFICFSILAFNAIDRLTFPLRFIAKKLKTTSLGHNQPIEWKANDEIGLLVKEYNRMLGNLEQNKIDLARSQKESAWREIAQQVAHEIKNPLTPMKLTLQQMEQSISAAPVDQERAKKSIQTVLAQVDVLNGIAVSFSSFATMPTPVLSKVDITDLLKRTVSLFENQVNAEIRFDQSVNPVYGQGDEQLLGRIFSNIIINALQSRDNNKKVKLIITAVEDGDWLVVSFQDNGSGIPQELQNKIFLPHFSTKNTGSGLGLAIAKQGMEQMGGAIWFETSNGHGTTFFVKLKSASSNL